MAIENGQVIRVVMPGHLFAALQSEAKDTAMPMANLVRLAVQQRYKRQWVQYHYQVANRGRNGNDKVQGLMLAYINGQVTMDELVDKLTILAERAEAE